MTPALEEIFAQSVLASLRKQIREISPTHVLYVRDPEGECFRSTLYPEYKAGRPRLGPSTSELHRLLAPYLDHWNVATFEVEGFEADDTIYTVALRSLARGSQVTVLSADRDLLQLVHHGAEVLVPIPGQGNMRGVDFLQNKYQIRPDQLLDYKVMVGEDSDNIPRIEIEIPAKTEGAKPTKRGVTEKRAMELLAHFGSLDEIFRACEDDSANTEVLPEKERVWFRACRDRALFFRDLITLRGDVPLTGLDPAMTAVSRLRFDVMPERAALGTETIAVDQATPPAVEMEPQMGLGI